jgi:hypothetical protein
LVIIHGIKISWMNAHWGGGGGSRLLSHYNIFRVHHVWTSTIQLLWNIFTMFLHILVGQNPKNQMAKKLRIFISCNVMLENICTKNCTSHHTKNENILVKWLKWFIRWKYTIGGAILGKKMYSYFWVYFGGIFFFI